MSMSASMVGRQLARHRRLFPCLDKDYLLSQQLHQAHGKPEALLEDKEERDVVGPRLEALLPGDYRLHYSPLSYRRPKGNYKRKTKSDKDDQCHTTLTHSFRQASNYYSVSSSRRLSSTTNTLLDLAFNKTSEAKTLTPLHHCKDCLILDVKPDPRAFQRCRPEYGSVTLDLAQRPTPIESKQAFHLLHKVTVLKGSMKPMEVTQFLVELGCLQQEQTALVRSDTRFIKLLRYAVENLRYFTHPELLHVLQSFVWLGLPSTHSILGPFEAELCHRASQMSVQQLLLAADLWRCLRRPMSQFLKHIYDAINVHIGQLGIAELVQLLYVMGEGRHCPKQLVGPIEHLLRLHTDKLQPEEIGTICLGLFKSQTSLSVGAVNYLVDKAYSVVEEMSDFAMVNVLKLMRFSYLDHIAWLEVMEQEVPRRAPRMSVQGLMHVALTCSALHYRNDHILQAVAERLPSLATHCKGVRSKDSCKLLWAFGTLRILPHQYPDFYPSLIEALRDRKAEFQRYPEHLLTGLLGLAFVSQLPEDLLTLALSPEFVRHATSCKQLDLKKDLFTLDGTVALEIPHWTGPRLDCKLREEVVNMLWKYAQSDVCQKPEVVEAQRALQDLLGGEEFVHKRMILPHTRSIDLEVHFDNKGQPQPVNSPSCRSTLYPVTTLSSSSNQAWEKVNIGVTLTDDLLSQLVYSRKSKDILTSPLENNDTDFHRIESDEDERMFIAGVDIYKNIPGSLRKSRPVHTPRDKGIVKLAIQVSNRNHYCYHSHQLLGLHAMKRKQLRLAGYRIVELYHWEWFPLLKKSNAEKLAYLHCKIYSSLD